MNIPQSSHTYTNQMATVEAKLDSIMMTLSAIHVAQGAQNGDLEAIKKMLSDITDGKRASPARSAAKGAAASSTKASVPRTISAYFTQKYNADKDFAAKFEELATFVRDEPGFAKAKNKDAYVTTRVFALFKERTSYKDSYNALCAEFNEAKKAGAAPVAQAPAAPSAAAAAAADVAEAKPTRAKSGSKPASARKPPAKPTPKSGKPPATQSIVPISIGDDDESDGDLHGGDDDE